MPNQDDPTTWIHTITRVWKTDVGGQVNLSGAEALSYMRQKTETFSEPFRSAVMWVPEGSECHINTMTYVSSEPASII